VRQALRAHLLEIAVILITLIGFNLDRIFPEANGIGVVVACISLLAWAAIIFTSEDQFKIERFSVALVLIRIIMPIIALVTTLAFYAFRHEPPQPQQILKQTVQASECVSMRYGNFTMLNDTIVRFQHEGKDLEIRNGMDTFNVSWIDSCTYRVSKPGRLLEFYRIIDINSSQIFLEKMRNDFKKYVIVQTRIN
jgi:hypothetical protein